MEPLTDLAVKSIEDHATSKIRIASLETAVTGMTANNMRILEKIGEIQTSLALITQTQNHIQTDAQETRQDLDTLIADHIPCKSLAQEISQNADAHRELAKRVDTVETNCERCPISGYKELSEKVDVMSKDLKDLCKALNVVTYSLKLPVLNMPIPVWILFVLLVLMGAAFDVANNWEWLMTAWGVVK
jgi:chromosome segregation ATPase